MDEKAVKDQMDAIVEVVESMKAVKGEQFAMVASHTFESLQVFELACALAQCDGSDKDYIEKALSAISKLSASMTSKLARGMDSSLTQEAINMGTSLMYRKKYLQNQLGKQ